MRLTRASAYAIHAVAYMAAQKYDHPIASHHIALARSIPERFLLKVLKPLVSARLLLSVKGPNGGYRLARTPDDISLLDVIEAAEGPYTGLAPLHEDSADNPISERLQAVCKQAADQVRRQLAKVTIADLIKR